MPSTYSSLLRLELMAFEEKEDLWGPILNQQLEQLERAVDGVFDVSTATGTVTLSDSDGEENESNYRRIRCTATLTGNLTIVVPNRTLSYIIENATNGSFTVTVKTSSGTGYVVQQGYTQEVFCNGSNVVYPNGAAWKNTSVTAHEGLIGGYDKTSAIQRILSTTTGSGAIYFGDQDDDDVGGIEYDHSADEMTIRASGAGRLKLTSTALLPLADNQIDLGSSSVKFKDGYFDGSLKSDLFQAPSGSVTSPTYSFDGDTNTGLFSPAADQIALAAGGTSILSSTTSLATFGLSEVRVDGTTNTYFYLDRSASNLRGEYHLQTAGVTNWVIGVADSDEGGNGEDFYIGTVSGWSGAVLTIDRTNGNLAVDTDTLFVDAANDRIGVNTASPSADFHVVGQALYESTASSITLQFKNAFNGGNTLFRSNGNITEFIASRELFLGVNAGTNLMLLNNNGRVGVGSGMDRTTVGPDTLFHIYAGSAGSVTASANAELTVESSTSTGIQLLSPSTTSQYILFGDESDNDVGWIEYRHSVNKMFFLANASEILTIDGPNSRVGVREASPNSRFTIDEGNLNIGNMAQPASLEDGILMASGTGPTSNTVSGVAIWFNGTNIQARVGGTTRTIDWT